MKLIPFLPWIVCLSAAGCSPTLDGHEVLDQTAPVSCAKYEECRHEEFVQQFPNGIDQCVEVSKEGTRVLLGAELDKNSSCTQAELDDCLYQLERLDCPEGNGPVAASCQCPD